jgi:hypothetical protein
MPFPLEKKNITLILIIQCVQQVLVFFNVVIIRGDDYHTATTFYLTKLFKNGIGLTQAARHHGTNDQSRKTAEENSGCYFQDIDSQKSNHPYQVNESILDNTAHTVGKGTLREC